LSNVWADQEPYPNTLVLIAAFDLRCPTKAQRGWVYTITGKFQSAQRHSFGRGGDAVHGGNKDKSLYFRCLVAIFVKWATERRAFLGEQPPALSGEGLLEGNTRAIRMRRRKTTLGKVFTNGL